MSAPVCAECGRVGMFMGWTDSLEDKPSVLHYGCANGHTWDVPEDEDE